MIRLADILILGGGAAGLYAAKAAREQDPYAQIVMISGESLPAYSRPMLTKLPLQHYDPERTLIYSRQWYNEKNIELLLKTQTVRLDVKAHLAETNTGVFLYKTCVYALGADNFVPPFPGRDLPGVCTIRRDTDIANIRRQSMGARRAVVIGGGVIGLEAAYQLQEQGLDVTVMETAPYLMPRLLDEDSSRELQRRITRLRILTDVRVLGMEGKNRVTGVRTEGLGTIPAELVIVSCGVRANAALAQRAGLATDRGVLVDAQMRTSDPCVYACGDCTQYRGGNTGLWSQAKAQGNVAGTNAAGGKAEYSGSDQTLLLHCPEFDLFSLGDLGKQPDRQYEAESRWIDRPKAYEVNPRASGAFVRDYRINGKLVGTFVLGDLSHMEQKKREILGGCP